ncbi:MAG: hypothetical protein R2879_18520 [Saprospiraceae bacterium]
MIKKLSIFALLFSFATFLGAQDLLSPSFTFSHKKPSYVTLQDGTTIEGEIKDLDRKKGLIEEIKIKDTNGKKHKLEPKEVKYMYLPPSGIDNLSKKMNFMHDATKWKNDKLNQDFLENGYVYFETVDVKIKKKTMPLLMQLLNPDFSKTVKVYHDPLAKETASVGVGGIKVAGGIAKSYFIMTDKDKAAYKIEKKKYKDSFSKMWSDCKNLSKSDDIKWSELTKHIITYTECN